MIWDPKIHIHHGVNQNETYDKFAGQHILSYVKLEYTYIFFKYCKNDVYNWKMQRQHYVDIFHVDAPFRLGIIGYQSYLVPVGSYHACVEA